ncbi:uncharacterized protein JCM6883_006242 [Sporobolomyces salmoneus]|uniref:uncharacterized protein n=1 Tax=Sporobolomyces salmoneus TaxID=183962 RepID=UPI00317D1AE0
MPPSSRIPTRNTRPTSSFATTNENVPPPTAVLSADPKAPPSKPASISKKSRGSTINLRDRSNAQEQTPAIKISVQLPSSDGGRGGEDERDEVEETERNPQLTNEEQGESSVMTGGEQATIKETQRTTTQKSSLLPVPTSRRHSRSRSRSKSPQILPPSKPTYATLTSRRRSAAAALRRQSTSASTSDSVQTPSSVDAPSVLVPTKAPRRSLLRAKPRPSEILALPVGPPQHPPELDASDDDDDEETKAIEEDELMLLPPERGRGKGEGKEGVWKKWEREREEIRERSRSRSRSVVQERDLAQEKDIAGELGEQVQHEEEEFDYGGFDGTGYVDDEPFEYPEQVVASEGGRLEQNESQAVNFGSDDEGVEEREEEVERPAELNDEPAEPNRSFDDEDKEEEDRKDFLPLQDQASSDVEPENDEDLPFADQPRYSLSQSPVPTEREETPRALQEGRSYSEIFPPLSPNTTGEFDELEPTRFSSSPPPEIRVQERSSVEEEQEIEPELEETRPSERPSPLLEEPTAEQTSQTSDVRALGLPNKSRLREITPLSPAYLKFEREAFTSPGPVPSSLLSPSSFLTRAFSRPRSLTPVDSAPSPRQIPQLNFVPLPSPRSRNRLQLPSRSPSAASVSNAPTTRARQPSPLALASTLPPTQQQEWTRGPGFFRSSSFTPPPVRSSFDRKGKAKARDQDNPGEEEEEEEEEQSREYWKPTAMTATSPHVSERAQSVEHDQQEEEEEEEEEEDEIQLARQPSSSPSNNDNNLAPPTPSKDRSSLARDDYDPGHESDTSMRSPVASLRSRHSSAGASPPRSPNTGDYIMSSPVASIRSVKSFEMSLSPASVTSNKKLPATPPPGSSEGGGGGALNDDERMRSPSPARTQSALGVPTTEQGQLRRSPSRLEELVEAGKEKLTGLLSFGSPKLVPARSGTPTTTSEQVPEASTSILEPRVSKHQSVGSRVEEEEEVHENEDADDDQPFPLASNRQSHAPAHPSTYSANPTANESIFSNLSYANSTSRRHRRRPSSSNPSLPVIEISSTDAKAAARAAAILKVYHKYVEQGIEGSLARDEASRVIREAEKNGQEIDAGEYDEEEEEEEELRTLLLDAEEEVRETFGRGISVGSSERQSSTSKSPEIESANRDEVEVDESDEEEEEVRSVLLSDHSRSPSVSQRASPPTITSHGEASSHTRSRSVSGLSSVVGEKWTSQEWRRLEQSLVELKRKMKGESREVEAIEVVEAFLHKWGVQKEECHGDWEWDKLLIRVEAIKARRAKDVREHRAGSQASALSISVASSSGSDNSSQVAQEGSESDRDETLSPARTIVKEEEIEQRLERSDHGSDSEDSDYDDEEEERSRDRQDDTFFATNRRLRRTRRTSMPHTRLPTALSNPRLAHIYDDAPAPEKPRLPIRELLERGESTEPVIAVESTPEPEAERENDSALAPPSSSAQRLFSYLGSFVRRSPAPSPSTSKFAPSSSISPSLEPSEGEEMSETRLRPPVVTPRVPADRNSQLANRKIRPLPHSSHDQYPSASFASTSTPVASTSRATLDIPSTATRGNRSIRRRRSSGEEGRVWEAVVAIEEAESSREEEEARIIELLRSGSAKRKASAGDLRRKVQRGGGRA